ncbi:MAG: ATP-binding protein [Acidobacteriota bacterium]
MRTSTRLILLLTLTVSAVMVIATYLTSQNSARLLEDAARDEIRVHAITLQMALEEDYLSGGSLDAQRFINRLGSIEKIYCVILFDDQGEISMVSNSINSEQVKDPLEAQQAIATGKAFETVRQINNQTVFSIIAPLQVNEKRIGALEVAQPISFVNRHIAQTRRDTVLLGALICLAMFLVVLAVTRFSLANPIKELLGGAVAFGSGDLSHRVKVHRGGSELKILASEFNRMADQLAEQRARIATEAEERLQLERKLRHSERLATVGRLAAGVAHEIGAPLQVIDGRAKQLQESLDAPVEKRQRNLAIIRAQVDRISRIIRNLLNLARPYNLNLKKIDLQQAIATVVEALETQAARAGVRIKLESENGVAVKADADLLNQVLLNIALNGIQAMPGGGFLCIRYTADAGIKDGERFASIRISDNGSGIANEHLLRIFDPFFTTKEVGSGTGLGLAVSSRIVEEHGGWIEAGNNSEGGATFTIYLPQN